MSLSKAEEQLMEIIWTHEKAFMKDIIEGYPDPRPAKTTIATLLKRVQNKGYVAYQLFGNSRQYYPLVEKKKYFSEHVKGIIGNFFDGSPINFASFFARSTNFSKAELEELREIIDKEIERKDK